MCAFLFYLTKRFWHSVNIMDTGVMKINTTTENVLEAIAKLKEGEANQDKKQGEVNLLSIAEKLTRNRKRGQ